MKAYVSRGNFKRLHLVYIVFLTISMWLLSELQLQKRVPIYIRNVEDKIPLNQGIGGRQRPLIMGFGGIISNSLCDDL